MDNEWKTPRKDYVHGMSYKNEEVLALQKHLQRRTYWTELSSFASLRMKSVVTQKEFDFALRLALLGVADYIWETLLTFWLLVSECALEFATVDELEKLCLDSTYLTWLFFCGSCLRVVLLALCVFDTGRFLISIVEM